MVASKSGVRCMATPQPGDSAVFRGRGYARAMRHRAIARAVRVADGEPVRGVEPQNIDVVSLPHTEGWLTW